MTGKVPIVRLKTGIAGLDEMLGGGIPEFSLNLVAGTPGSGKTTLSHQIMFALATPERPAIFFTVLGEPPLKMLRYQQQYSFFDVDEVDRSIYFVNLSGEMAHGDYAAVLTRIRREVEERGAGLVFVDSFRSVAQAEAAATATPRAALQQFVQDLAMHLTSWRATTFLIGEYSTIEGDGNPVFTIADGIIWLTQVIDRNSAVRKMQASKMRGQAPLPGLHTFRIDEEGVHVFPRRPSRQRAGTSRPRPAPVERVSIGIPRLDQLLGGGIPSGYSLLVTGPSGSGKSVLATAFLAEGTRRKEAGILAVFETDPGRLRSSALDALVDGGGVTVFDTRNLDLSVDETLHTLTDLVRRTGAKRVVIDSVSGFELALAPSFRQDFRESLYRMVSSLMDLETTVLLTCELEDRYGDLRFSPYGAAFLTDAIIVQRYVEIEGALRRVLAVVKVRNSEHHPELYRYDITADGINIGDRLHSYRGLLTGSPLGSDAQPEGARDR